MQQQALKMYDILLKNVAIIILEEIIMLAKFLMLTIVDYYYYYYYYYANTCPHDLIGWRRRLLYFGHAVAKDKFILRVR